ncbi:glutamate receptor delta-1 subunit precursor -like protein [Dermatophagoides farinae]|uniref:Glutamate receptor delta-1 subunit -like protein n=1 Tax=Dermatophagoides farinae TaxID=6954 RepID=A0A9D4NWK3_DERFA|nr:glutamate receptor delta-1 subunit precursor -like protein [Dermatophagoides farinae]
MRLNLQQKTFNVGINDYPPFILLHGDGHCRQHQQQSQSQHQQQSQSCRPDGIEIRLLEILEFYYNFTSNLIPFAGRYGRMENGTWNGIVHGLLNGNIDFGLGGVTLRNDRIQVIDYLHPHWTDQFSFATSPIERKHKIQQFLHPFSTDVWLALILVFIMFFLVDRLMINVMSTTNTTKRHYRGRYEQHCVWIALRSLLRQPYQWMIGTEKVAESFPQRIILGIWMLNIAVLTSIYSGGLLSELTVPNSNIIDSIEKLADACQSGRLTMFGTVKDFNFFRNFTRKKSLENCQETISMQKSGIEKLVEKTIEMKMVNGHYQARKRRKKYDNIIGTFVSRERANFLQNCYGLDALYLPPSNYESTFFTLWVAIPISPKNFHYQTEFNDVISQLKSSGILKLWAEHISLDAKTSYYKHKASKFHEYSDKDMDNSDDSDEIIVSKITLNHMHIVFIVLIICLINSTIIFSLEILIACLRFQCDRNDRLKIHPFKIDC